MSDMSWLEDENKNMACSLLDAMSASQETSLYDDSASQLTCKAGLDAAQEGAGDGPGHCLSDTVPPPPPPPVLMLSREKEVSSECFHIQL